MLKKIGFGALAGIVVLALMTHTRAGHKVSSYFGTAWNKCVTGAEQEVPIEFEIERLQHETAQLTPDMRKHLGVIAEEMVAVETLQKDIAADKARLESEKKNILTMTEDVKSGSETIVYDGRDYPKQRVVEKLDRDLSAYDRAENELKRKEKLLGERQKALDVAREQLAVMKNKKQELEMKLAELQTKVKTLRLAQSKSNVQLDDSRLAHIQASIADLEKRLDVEVKTTELADQYLKDPIPVDKKAKSEAEVLKRAEARFGNGAKADAKVADRK